MNLNRILSLSKKTEIVHELNSYEFLHKLVNILN